ncbi:zinc finger, CCHC-type containing protein [Tanacetum coccineum]
MHLFGYAEHSKAFRFYVIEPNESVSINFVIESKDAIFDDNRFSSVPRPSLRIPKGTEDIGGSVVPEKVTEEVVQQPEPELRKSKKNRTPKNFGHEFQLYLIEGTRDEVSDQHSYCFNVEDDPKTFDEAMKLQMNLQKKTEVSRISTLRLLIAMVSIHNLIIHQMDVKTAFLNGELDEEAPKQWHQKFNEVVLSNGYLLNQADKYVYSKFDKSGKGVIIFLYVDDMLIFSTDQVQSHYIEKVLKKFNYFDCTPVSTPMDTSEKLMSNNGQAVSQLEYSRVIGCLMYTMTCTSPDSAFAVGKLSRYTSNLGTQHWQAIQRVTLMQAGSATLKTIRLPVAGYSFLVEVQFLGESKKQTCITGSTMKSEFVALSATGKEAKWLRNLILDVTPPKWITAEYGFGSVTS